MSSAVADLPRGGPALTALLLTVDARGLGGAMLDQKEIDAVVRVMQTGMSVGAQVQTFEKRAAALLGKEHGVMVNSGSSALLLAVLHWSSSSLSSTASLPRTLLSSGGRGGGGADGGGDSCVCVALVGTILVNAFPIVPV